jgi:hypothetical protein
MTFRLSQKLSVKIKAGPLAALSLHGNPLADWSAHLFMAGRTQFILLSNTRALYSTVFFGMGITNVGVFVDRALTGLREVMAVDGLEAAYRRLVVPASGSVRFAKALDRSVTGSMNDLVNQAKCWLTEGGLPPHEVGVRLNDNLLSVLAPSEWVPYGTPRAALKALLSPTAFRRRTGGDAADG